MAPSLGMPVMPTFFPAICDRLVTWSLAVTISELSGTGTMVATAVTGRFSCWP